MKVIIPIKLPSIANNWRSWRRMSALKKKQKQATKLCLLNKTPPSLPLQITITRIGPRKLDDDNLAIACKYVRDQIAEFIGTDDGSSLYTWLYSQRKGSYSVEIEIKSRGC